MNAYLKQAGKLYSLSKKELNEARRLNDNEIARDASGKAWIATTDALRGYLITHGLKEKELPKSERQRHDLLAEYGDKKMRLLYRSIRGEFHENAYYEGKIHYLFLFEALSDIKKFIRLCENGNTNS